MASKKRILVVFGTRPEAIKMAPVVLALRDTESWDVAVCVTGQHRAMLDQVLDLFKIKPNFDLNLMRADQTLADLTADVLRGVQNVISEWKPDRVLVHGDTATTLATSLAAYFSRVPVGHVEAGLRTGNIYEPWPEEINRKLTAGIADLHFAPTSRAKENLLREGILERQITITGNTVIDALRWARSILDQNAAMRLALDQKFNFLDPEKNLILVTGHRRESFGHGFENICLAIKEIALRPDIQVLYPVHLNPNVQTSVQRFLSGTKNVFLVEPQDYLAFVYLMSKAYIILTDSGGVQEEAPSMGKPVLVMRDITERPEIVFSGGAKVVGTSRSSIIHNLDRLLSSKEEYGAMIGGENLYGDGMASARIAKVLSQEFKQ